jgi:nucleoside-diphosphate-sugar epimerase
LETLVHVGFEKGRGRFVLVSSQAAAGPSPDGVTPVLESDAPAPASMYARSKLEAEKVALAFSDQVSVTIVRPPTVFGPRDTDALGVFRAAKMRIAPYIIGAARLVSVVYVKDLVRGIIMAAESERAAGETFFLANQNPVVWKDFCASAGRALGRSCLPLPIPLGIAGVLAKAGDLVGRFTGAPAQLRSDKFEDMRQKGWVCSAEKAERLLGWVSMTPLMEALTETARWYEDQGWL